MAGRRSYSEGAWRKILFKGGTNTGYTQVIQWRCLTQNLEIMRIVKGAQTQQNFNICKFYSLSNFESKHLNQIPLCVTSPVKWCRLCRQWPRLKKSTRKVWKGLGSHLHPSWWLFLTILSISNKIDEVEKTCQAPYHSASLNYCKILLLCFWVLCFVFHDANAAESPV